MVLMELTFPAGRYHATPWGRHVNEGAVEWPPSPWRLLRALIAVYRRKRCELEPREVMSLMNALASSPPIYALPAAVGAHTRQYMPLYKEKTAKIFDAFLHIEHNGRLHICWPELELEAPQAAALSALLEGLGYLGRAESWLEARLLSDNAPVPAFNACVAENPFSQAPDDTEAESVLCPVTPEAYATWRERAYLEEQTQREQEQLFSKRQRAIAKNKNPEKVELTDADTGKIANSLKALFPETLFEALQADTGDLQSQGWSAPPGSTRTVYWRPPVERARTRIRPRKRAQARPSTVRLALAPDTVAADTRPRVHDTLYLGEQIRRALMSLSKKLAEERGEAVPQCASVFSGKDEHGDRLDDNHRHAFCLPCDDDGDNRIDHVLIHAPAGFSYDEITAIGRLRNLWQYGGRPGLLVVYLSEGHPEDFGGFKARDDQSPFAAASRVWHSHTPYVPTRHAKRNKRGEPKRDTEGRWIDSPEMQIRDELQRRGLPAPIRIEHYAPRDNAAEWRRFATRRKNGNGARAQTGVTGFRIEFDKPVSGPMALGYGCHFGLGLFVAEPGGA